MVISIMQVVFIYGVLAFIDLMPLIHQRKMKEIIVYGAIFGVAFVFSIVLVLKIPLVSLSQLTENVIKIFFDI